MTRDLHIWNAAPRRHYLGQIRRSRSQVKAHRRKTGSKLRTHNSNKI